MADKLKLTERQIDGLKQLQALQDSTAGNDFDRIGMPVEGLWWMPRDGRSISYQTVKSLHAKGLIERHPNRTSNFDWCRILPAGRDALASPPDTAVSP